MGKSYNEEMLQNSLEKIIFKILETNEDSLYDILGAYGLTSEERLYCINLIDSYFGTEYEITYNNKVYIITKNTSFDITIIMVSKYNANKELPANETELYEFFDYIHGTDYLSIYQRIKRGKQ